MKKVILLSLMLTTFVFAQKPIEIVSSVAPESVKPGGQGVVTLDITIPEGYHISGPDEGMFEVYVDSVQMIEFLEVDYPKSIKDDWGHVYRKSVQISLPFHVAKATSEGVQFVSLNIFHQPCDEVNDICYMQQTKTMKVDIDVSSSGSTILTSNEGGSFASRVSEKLQQGSFIAFIFVFLGGLLTSLTPCVYPMIPITIAVIGAQATGGKLKGFILSLFYVLGISLTFSSLGVVAAKTGGLFGSYAQHPAVNGVIAVILFLMGLSMLGAFVVQLPASLRMKIQGKKRSGFIGAFLTGIVAGLIVSPCVSPLLVVILTYVAKTGDALMGFGLLFTFAWGIGLLFIVLGTFSGLIKTMPKPGGWAEHIEQGFGILLIGLALFFLRTLVSVTLYTYLWGIGLVLLGYFLWAEKKSDTEIKRKPFLVKALGIVILINGTALIFQIFSGRDLSLSSGISESQVQKQKASFWMTDEAEAFSLAKKQSKPILLDFYADWCPACHELDEKTWPDPTVQNAIQSYIPLKYDLTKQDDRMKALYAKYGIVGMPTIIALNPEGEELGRFTGFQSPEFVVKFLEQHSD